MYTEFQYRQMFITSRRYQVQRANREKRLLDSDENKILCPQCDGTGSWPHQRGSMLTGNACCDVCNMTGLVDFEIYKTYMESETARTEQYRKQLREQRKKE